ncbi:hypothetical protein DL98DRAFT_609189 [Cadophora sp. DSE1049]|nr:hypothetical protein DL98DRAFT_609189 [Cadophora sp. DSE1049]
MARGAAFRESMSRQETSEFDPESWGELITMYSALDLTFYSDKLNAVAGMAARAAARWSTTYLAGLWKEELPVCLLWNVCSNSSNQPKGKFPSWSWASSDVAVKPGSIILRGRELANFDQLLSLTRATYHESDDVTAALCRTSILRLDRRSDIAPESPQCNYLLIVVERNSILWCLVLRLDDDNSADSRQIFKRVGTFDCKEDSTRRADIASGFRVLRSRFREEDRVLV